MKEEIIKRSCDTESEWLWRSQQLGNSNIVVAYASHQQKHYPPIFKDNFHHGSLGWTV